MAPSRSRVLYAFLVVGSSILLFTIWRLETHTLITNQLCPNPVQSIPESISESIIEQPLTFKRPPLLNGNATLNFKDNLRPELQYVTGFYTGGFTNQFMTISNLILISLLTPRIPVLPAFTGVPHMSMSSGWKKVSEIFDLQRWEDYINKGMVEWADVKILDSNHVEPIGCWSVWATVNPQQDGTRGIYPLNYVQLDPSYTSIPPQAKLNSVVGDVHVRFNELAYLSTVSGRKMALESLPKSEDPNQPSPAVFPNGQGQFIEPDEELLCFDFLYFVSGSHTFEWEQSYSNAWNLVGKYARWNDEMRTLGRETLALTLGVSPSELMVPTQLDKDYDPVLHGPKRYPRKSLQAMEERDTILYPFIAIHARHGDFLNGCGNRPKGSSCYPLLSSFKTEVDSIREEIWKLKGVRIKENDVIVTSDDTTNEWWDEVAAMGWKRIEIPKALASKDPGKQQWDLMLAEVVIQGWAKGFLGTEGSTLSLLGKRRVEEWQNGLGRFMRFSVWSDWR